MRARLTSNWIEVFAVPIASAIMETQPVAVILFFVAPHLFSVDSPYPDAASITFLLLFLHWWAMGIRSFFEQRASKTRLLLYDALGIVAALALVAVTHLALITDPTFSFLALLIAGWGWKRGADRARAGLSEEQLINAFKTGFTALLITLCFALLALFAATSELANVLLRDLPIFFLAGMITLSFTRLGLIRQEQARHVGSGRHEKLGGWLTALTITWSVLVVVSIALEALPLPEVRALVSPLWNLLGLIALAIVTVFDFFIRLIAGFFSLLIALFVLLLHIGGPLQQGTAHAPQPVQHTPDSDLIMFILRMLVAVLIIGAIIVITRLLQRRQAAEDEAELDEEEIREGLNIRQVLRSRRRERAERRPAIPPVALEPDSVRARYRAFLQAMADRGADFARRAQETPAEYQQRLLSLQEDMALPGAGDAPADPDILAELTQAYNRERYGGMQAGSAQRDFLRRWLPHLTQRLSQHLAAKSEKIARPGAKTSYSPWGED